ncbi:peroxide stress protein YaaA, partial [Enterocloster bolteae]
MKIIISPAKKMNIREDELEWANLPCFLSRAEELKRYIQGLDLDQARKLWQCNEKIALLNYGRFKEMDLERRLTPALLSYEGIQYQYMAPGVFEQGQWDYV